MLKEDNCNIYFDFDNTITPFDVLDDIIERFAVNDDWKAMEKKWASGKIGAKECLEGQLKCVRVSRTKLSGYLSGIKVDPYFHRILDALGERDIAPVILSDNFHFIVDSILKNNGIKKIKIYSNELKFKKDQLIPSFPHQHKAYPGSGNCKPMHILKNSRKNCINIYVGDGRSDIDAAETSDFVFAKDSLLKHFRSKKKKCVPFNDLGDVYRYLNTKEDLICQENQLCRKRT